MTTPAGWLGLVAGDWTVNDDPRSCAWRAVRAGRALGLRTLAVSTEDRCLARLAAEGWSLRPASGPGPEEIASAFIPAGNRAGAPALLLGDGTGLAEPTARAAMLLGGRIPDPAAVSRCAEVIAGQRGVAGAASGGAPARRYVLQVQDGEVLGFAEDVTVGGHGRDYDCPGGAGGHTARLLRDAALGTLRAAGLTRGPAEVIVHTDGRVAYTVDVVPGRIDACVASVLELATGHDPILRAVWAAVAATRRSRRGPGAGGPGAGGPGAGGPGAGGPGGDGPGGGTRHPGAEGGGDVGIAAGKARRAWGTRQARRHACLRRADLRAVPPYPDAAWIGLPGVVSARPGLDGMVITVGDDRASAVRAAELAVCRLSGRIPPAVAVPGGAR